MTEHQPVKVPAQAYTFHEEVINAVSHGIGLIFAVVGMVYLLLKSDSSLALTTSAIYGASLTFMFLASTLYHSANSVRGKQVLKLLDHSAIYLLIAGTYTPFLAVSIGGWIGWLSISIIWLIALFGVLFKLFAKHRFPRVSVFTYLAMGWLAIFLAYPLYTSVAAFGLFLLISGGLCFSIGVIFYVQKHIRFTHAIWHLFVIAGCACHYFSIYYFVL